MSQPVDETTEWYADGLSFACTQCGNCCTGAPGFVWFNDEEAKAMADFLGLDEREFRQRYSHRKFGKWTLDERKNDRGDYDCVFLRRDEQGRSLCSVYAVRPMQCRTWPFWRENLTTPDHWKDASQTCPGMRASAGDFYPVEQIRIILAKNDDEL